MAQAWWIRSGKVLALGFVFGIGLSALSVGTAAACPGDDDHPKRFFCPGDDDRPKGFCPGDDDRPKGFHCPGDDDHPKK